MEKSQLDVSVEISTLPDLRQGSEGEASVSVLLIAMIISSKNDISTLLLRTSERQLINLLFSWNPTEFVARQ